MKKLTIALTILAMSFAACNFTAKTDSELNEDTGTVSNVSITTDGGTATVTTDSGTPTTAKKPPSQEDGALYLKAIGTHDVKLCSQIKDADIKSRCMKEAPAK